jgi:hypothetical protein
MPPKIFLLSPANVSGLRGRQLTSPRAGFNAALRYRSAEGVPVADAFAFMSALYFRGKIAYARRFATAGLAPDLAPLELAPEEEAGVHVIAPGYGLVSPGWALTRERFRKIHRTPVDVTVRAYHRPLTRDARALAARLPADAQIVLLGSVATGKYVDVLRPVLGDRLRFPLCFAGVGDMARGAILLRAARSGEELEYGTLDRPRQRLRGEATENER